MKSLAQFSRKIGLLGGLVMSTVLAGLPAFALPQEDIVKKLSSIPMFTLTDQKGAPLVASVETSEGETSNAVAGVFVAQADAEAFLNEVKKNKKEFSTEIKVETTTLGNIYALAQDPSSTLAFELVPSNTDVLEAKAILTKQLEALKANPKVLKDPAGNPVAPANGQDGKPIKDEEGKVVLFPIIEVDNKGEPRVGVPLFFARIGDANQYLTIQQNDRQMIPFYFQKGDLEGIIELLENEGSSAVDNIRIEVISLSRIISTLEGSKEETNLDESLILVPPRETVNYIRSLPQTQTQP